jgi:Flp pilus assembly pilin Flp
MHYPMFMYTLDSKCKSKLQKIKNEIQNGKSILSDESGMGTVELILIIVVLIGLVIIFKKQLTSLVNTIFETITSKSNDVLG